jgi:hypothetical protein
VHKVKIRPEIRENFERIEQIDDPLASLDPIGFVREGMRELELDAIREAIDRGASLARVGDALGTHKQTVHDRLRTAGKLTGLTNPIFDGRTVSTLRYWLWWWGRPERSTDGSGPGEDGLIASEQIALITAELEARQAAGLLHKPIDPSSPR